MTSKIEIGDSREVQMLHRTGNKGAKREPVMQEVMDEQEPILLHSLPLPAIVAPVGY